tara:strand:- start:676 stop:1323 length:648 start_codon:yes stop_codon:yes gene_type:complete
MMLQLKQANPVYLAEFFQSNIAKLARLSNQLLKSLIHLNNDHAAIATLLEASEPYGPLLSQKLLEDWLLNEIRSKAFFDSCHEDEAIVYRLALNIISDPGDDLMRLLERILQWKGHAMGFLASLFLIRERPARAMYEIEAIVETYQVRIDLGKLDPGVAARGVELWHSMMNSLIILHDVELKVLEPLIDSAIAIAQSPPLKEALEVAKVDFVELS